MGQDKPGKLKAFFTGIDWGMLPLTYAHHLSNLLPNDEVFKNIRCRFLRWFGLKASRNGNFGKHVFISNYRLFSMGEKSSFGNDVYFDCAREIRIGNGCNIGFRSCFITGTHKMDVDPLSHRPFDSDKSGPITVGDYAWIGGNATILPGVTIGRGSIIGAGSVVTKNVEEFTLVTGVPARKVRSLR